jgi:ElaB/YqjD/DUF883 family membrane-anchored ribosome-binding protein
MSTQFNEEQNRGGFSGEVPNTATNVKDQMAEKGKQAKEMIADVGRKAADKINESREPAANKLNSAATSLHQTADSLPAGQTVTSAVHATADKLQATAEYVRDHDINAMGRDVEEFVRRYPGQSLIAAATVGFLVGRVFRSDN